MGPHHDHAPNAPCPPTCPAWAAGSLWLFSVQRRHAEMLEACRTAAAIESLDIAPSTQGVLLPEYLHDDDVVRLNLVVGRDTPEVLLDEWGVRCSLTFRGRRFDCGFPWASILGGVLRPPQRTRPRFGVIEGSEPAPLAPVPAEPVEPGAPGEAGRPAPQPPSPGPRRFGVIEGGKGKKQD